MDLPPRSASPNPFQDFSGGGYFYLDNHDRAVIPAGNRHILVVARDRRRRNPGFALGATTTSPRAVPERRRADLGASRLARADLVRQQEGRRRDRRAGERRRCAASTPASRSATRSRSTRPAASTSSPTRRMYRFDARDGQAGRDLAAHVPEHRRRQAGPDRGGLRDHADADRPPLRGDHRQRRPDARRRLRAQAAGATGARRGLQPAGVREGRQRHRPVADRRAGTRSSPRTTTATRARRRP